MTSREESPPDPEELTQALDTLASPVRLAIVRQLRTPKVLKEIEVTSSRSGPGSDDRPLARQTVKEHLDRLVDIGIVSPREVKRDYGPTVEYVVNNQVLYAVAERFRGLAGLRPREPPEDETFEGGKDPEGSRVEGPAMVLVKGLDEGRSFPVDPDGGDEPMIVGRRRDADVPLDFDPYVSRRNTVLNWEDGTLYVEDLEASRNGTRVNFELVPTGSRRPLLDGDLVGVGRSLLLFRA